MERGALCHQFSNIYVVALDKDATIEDYMVGQGDNEDWWIGFKRNLNDWEVSEYTNLLKTVSLFRRDQSIGDRLCWKLNPYGVFSVKSYYAYIYMDELVDVYVFARFIWKVKTTSRILHLFKKKNFKNIVFFTYLKKKNCILRAGGYPSLYSNTGQSY